ncbi:MAG TPA: glycine cleavage T C-terminal barrel domain-containing protein [Verrucomicrobiae bacterium]|nr:glycine cleavage T C-terminal barrel domain-containing protein [Verrucomicrobiae bacterium]
MHELSLHEFHQAAGARFTELNGWEVAAHYGDTQAEYRALQQNAAVLDLSFRSRICLTGADRIRFLNGQVTNNVKDLAVGQGCYAALVNAKGRLQSDFNIYCLPEEVLLDFEPGLSALVAERFNQFIIADDVQVVDVAALYGLISVQGPRASEVVATLEGLTELPARDRFMRVACPTLGEIYCMNQPRGTASGFDLFTPSASLAPLANLLWNAARQLGGGLGGWDALEMVRIEAGIPRFGADMDDTNLAPETGIDERAISYTKGCYIGQEVIARIRTYGQVAKALRGLWLPENLSPLPIRGDKLYHSGREAGYVTSALASPALGRNIALGYVRREWNQPGTALELSTAAGVTTVQVVALPFRG